MHNRKFSGVKFTYGLSCFLDKIQETDNLLSSIYVASMLPFVFTVIQLFLNIGASIEKSQTW